MNHQYRRTKPNLVQRIVLGLMPGRAGEIEAKTSEWVLTCPNCGLQRTLWDIGGVRYKFKRKGNPEGVRVRCPACGRRGRHPLEHRS